MVGSLLGFTLIFCNTSEESWTVPLVVRYFSLLAISPTIFSFQLALGKPVALLVWYSLPSALLILSQS